MPKAYEKISLRAGGSTSYIADTLAGAFMLGGECKKEKPGTFKFPAFSRPSGGSESTNANGEAVCGAEVYKFLL